MPKPKRKLMIAGQRFVDWQELADTPDRMEKVARDLLDELEFVLTCQPKPQTVTRQFLLSTEHDTTNRGIWTTLRGTIEVDQEVGETSVEVIEL